MFHVAAHTQQPIYLPYAFLFFFQCCGLHRDLLSFPTRRSSDLDFRLGRELGRVALAGPPLLKSGNRLGLPPHGIVGARSEEHTSELQSHSDLVCRLLLEKKKNSPRIATYFDSMGIAYLTNREEF